MRKYEDLKSVAIDYTPVLEGIEESLPYKVSYWDGPIVAAANALGCKNLYSEDFNHGQFYGSVQAINTFIAD